MLIGKCNKFGNIDTGYAVIDKLTGDTIYKTDIEAGINLDRIKPGEKAKFIKVDSQRDVIPMSKRASEAIKKEILTISGYRGLKL